jgi:hypothetical protein
MMFYIYSQRIVLSTEKVIYQYLFLQKDVAYSAISYVGIEDRQEQGYRSMVTKKYLVIRGADKEIAINTKPFGKMDVAKVVYMLHEKAPRAEVNGNAQMLGSLDFK